jgi:hypothetical protein
LNSSSKKKKWEKTKRPKPNKVDEKNQKKKWAKKSWQGFFFQS